MERSKGPALFSLLKVEYKPSPIIDIAIANLSALSVSFQPLCVSLASNCLRITAPRVIGGTNPDEVYRMTVPIFVSMQTGVRRSSVL